MSDTFGPNFGPPVAIVDGGTGNITKAAAFDALQPMTTGGDIIYGGASGTGTRLANGTNGQVLTSSGTTVAPTWATPAAAAVIVLDWTGTLSISHDSATNLTYASASFTKLAGNFTHSSGTFTCVTAGYYLINVGWQQANVSTSSVIRHFRSLLYLNGSEKHANGWVGGAASNTLESKNPAAECTGIFLFAVNDTFNHYAYQSNSGGAAYNTASAFVNVIFLGAT